MRSDLKGDSETMSDWFPIGEIMDTNSRKVTIPAFVSVGGNEVKFEIDASNIEGLDVDH